MQQDNIAFPGYSVSGRRRYNGSHNIGPEFQLAPEFEFQEGGYRELQEFDPGKLRRGEWANEYQETYEQDLEAGTISRSGTQYIAWVQSSLNKILGLNLVVDGISGVQTRSAIRSFQAREGLTVDGSVGPITEAALLRAGASPVPGGTPSTQPTIPSIPMGGTFRSRLVAIALAEYSRWGNGSRKETESAMQPILKDYWVTGTGSSSGYTGNGPWSAAFISWVVKKAGGGNNFAYSSAHTTYTLAAKQNRILNNANPFKAYRMSEKKPQPGDIIVQNRDTSRFTYDTIAAGPSHGDIVVSVGQSSITVIGGNLSDSVSAKTVPLDQHGFIRSSNHFAIIKVD